VNDYFLRFVLAEVNRTQGIAYSIEAMLFDDLSSLVALVVFNGAVTEGPGQDSPIATSPSWAKWSLAFDTIVATSLGFVFQAGERSVGVGQGHGTPDQQPHPVILRCNNTAEEALLKLWRAHALGNDYLVLEEGPPLTPALVRALCDRHRGMGSDGILEPMPAEQADSALIIWNPDGSMAEKSGNGLRIFARWLFEKGHRQKLSVALPGEVVHCEVFADRIAVEMGRCHFEPSEVPVKASKPVLDAPWQVGPYCLNVVAVGVGNPHCVVFRDEDLDQLPWREWGRLLESDSRFPNRTNVQIANVSGKHVSGRKASGEQLVEIRIWERGAGETAASGSSSCGVVAAAVKTGRLKLGEVKVHMPGGVLDVTIRQDNSLLLTGPVEVVGRLEVDQRWLASRY
jgi:diaminopimelate epimerase